MYLYYSIAGAFCQGLFAHFLQSFLPTQLEHSTLLLSDHGTHTLMYCVVCYYYCCCCVICLLCVYLSVCVTKGVAPTYPLGSRPLTPYYPTCPTMPRRTVALLPYSSSPWCIHTTVYTSLLHSSSLPLFLCCTCSIAHYGIVVNRYCA